MSPHYGRSGGFFGAAGLLGILALQALAATCIAALALVLPVWASALVVTAVLGLGAALAALAGKKQIARAGSPAPEQTIDSVKADLAAIKDQAAEQAAVVSGQIREKAEQAAQLVKDNTPDPVLERTAQAAAQVRDGASKAGRYALDKTPDPVLEKAGQAATAARAHRGPLLAAGAAVVALLLVRRSRGRRK